MNEIKDILIIKHKTEFVLKARHILGPRIEIEIYTTGVSIYFIFILVTRGLDPSVFI